MKTSLNTKNSEYRVIPNKYKFEVWLVSVATGKKISKHGALLTKELANEHIDWIKEQNKKYA